MPLLRICRLAFNHNDGNVNQIETFFIKISHDFIKFIKYKPSSYIDYWYTYIKLSRTFTIMYTID